MSETSGLRSLLAPLTPLYRLGLALRERRLATGREPIHRLRFPVLSIGNLSTGGSGKTPLTIALARALAARGYAVDVLSRGYGRSSTAPTRVNAEGPAKLYGDEPLLIARHTNAPVYVAPQRYDAGLLAETELMAETAPAAQAAAASRQGLHLLDDGFQHRQLHRDLDILLLDRADLAGRLLPAGNLREPLEGIRRADVVAIPATDPGLERDIRSLGFTGPIWRLIRLVEIPPDLARNHGPVLAFCGIARPAQFFSGLTNAGVNIAARRTFRDHHPYAQRDLDALTELAQRLGATLLTTKKDAIRLETLHAGLPIQTVGLSTHIENQPAALDWLSAHLPQPD